MLVAFFQLRLARGVGRHLWRPCVRAGPPARCGSVAYHSTLIERGPRAWGGALVLVHGIRCHHGHPRTCDGAHLRAPAIPVALLSYLVMNRAFTSRTTPVVLMFVKLHNAFGSHVSKGPRVWCCVPVAPLFLSCVRLCGLAHSVTLSRTILQFNATREKKTQLYHPHL